MRLSSKLSHDLIKLNSYVRFLLSFLFFSATTPLVVFSTATAQEDPNSRFGDRQVEQLIDDRPELESILKENQVLRNWIRDRFSAGTLTQRVFWDASEPFLGADSECMIPTEFQRAHIRVTSRANLAADDKCICLMFEFMNLENETGFNRLYQLAYQRQIDREQFANRALQLEMEAAIRLAAELQKEPYSKIFSKSKMYQGFISMPKQISSSDIKKWEKDVGIKRSLDYWRSSFDRLTGG